MRRALIAFGAAFVLATPARADYRPGIPPAVDPGTPVFAGQSEPVPTEPSAPIPDQRTLERIYQADLTAGGTSYWFDRVLERPYLSNNDTYLYTRGRALYMYTHQPNTLGFANGWAYRERPTGSNQAMYTVTISGATLTEQTAERRQYPSHWRSTHTATGLKVEQKKFITQNNVAVTLLTVTNTATDPTTRMVTVASPVATTSAALGTELTGSVNARFGLTTITPRLSATNFTVTGTSLTRQLTLQPGEATTLKVQFGATTQEIPESTTDYERYRDHDADNAFKTHLEEYNRWWVDNVPYIDIPDANVKKMSYYRTWLNRYNSFDGNIPGNDFQFPVSIEGVLGYNNAIQLTQVMHMQDLKYFRDPLYSYGDWVSSGESSKCTAFTDNPGNPTNWNNNIQQWIGAEAWQAYQVHGGEKAILRNLAHYAECDVKGQLAKFDANHNSLVEYASGFYTGNDSDAVALAFYNTPGTGRNAIGRAQDRTETAFWYSTAKASAEIYHRLGDSAKAQEMHALADTLKNAVLSLWDPVDRVFKMRDVETGNLIPWKDQQNFSPFAEGLAPKTDDYKQALRYWADAAQYSIMPFYTANRADKAAAAAAGKPGSNNFSNINATLQARLYAKALREYPTDYITPDMYRKLLEWLSWVQYVNGDNRYPDNNEYFSNWNPTTKTFTRSSIHHNILGAFNFMIIDDIVGLRPRLDDKVELWPIDVGYDHYLVDNLSYHGNDLSIVWDKPGDGKRYYGATPEGMSVYVNGRRVHTSQDLEHVVTDPVVSDADEAHLTGRTADMFQKAGVDLTQLPNLAERKPVTASFTAPETDTAFATDGFTISGPTVPVGSYVMNPAYGAANTIWGTKASPNAQDWLEVDLGRPTRIDSVKLYFFSNKQWANSPPQGPVAEGNTYREPASYTIQADGQNVATAAATPNYNHTTFEPVTATRVRVLMTPKPGYGIGVKELQVFDTRSRTETQTGVGGTVPATLALTLGPNASFGSFQPGVEKTYTATTTGNVISTAGDASLTTSAPGHLTNGAFALPQPLQVGISPASWSEPVSNAPVAIMFTQAIGATDALRTGAYSRTLTFTLSTTTP